MATTDFTDFETDHESFDRPFGTLKAGSEQVYTNYTDNGRITRMKVPFNVILAKAEIHCKQMTSAIMLSKIATEIHDFKRE
jgi:hypothetical protein